MTICLYNLSFAFHVPEWIATRTFSLLGQALLQFFVSKLGNSFTLSHIQGKMQASSGELSGTPWKVGGLPAWVKAEHGHWAITSTASLKTPLHARRGFLCGHRRSETSKQEAEHILKLGMLPVSWANLLLPRSGHGEAAYAWSAHAVLLSASSQY